MVHDTDKQEAGMKNDNVGKMKRVLGIYSKLMREEIVYKAEEAQRYGVSERSIQRDIDEIRSFLAEEGVKDGMHDDVVYDGVLKGYRLERIYRTRLSNSEILAVCKILLDSRAFTKGEMESMLEKMVKCCVPKDDRKMVERMIENEKFHYIEPRHKTVFLDTMWQLAQAIYESRYIVIRYRRLKGQECVERRLIPAAIMFSEYYFYLTAFIDNEEVRQHFDIINDSFPTIYRIDRILSFKVLDERARMPLYKDRFQEGEFRKRVQFMFGGKLQRVKFKYVGMSVEAVLDRLPTAKIVDDKDGVYTITAEVFGKGLEMWLRSQGDNIEILEIRNG